MTGHPPLRPYPGDRPRLSAASGQPCGHCRRPGGTPPPADRGRHRAQAVRETEAGPPFALRPLKGCTRPSACGTAWPHGPVSASSRDRPCRCSGAAGTGYSCAQRTKHCLHEPGRGSGAEPASRAARHAQAPDRIRHSDPVRSSFPGVITPGSLHIDIPHCLFITLYQ